MKFSLRDTETSNQFGQFEDEREVFMLVRTLVNHYGKAYADDLGLGRVSDEETILEPLTGAALVALTNEVLGDRLHEDNNAGEVVRSWLAAVGRGGSKR
jgi:hypothetical protein